MSTVQGYNMHLTSSTFSNIDLSIMRIYYFLKKEKRKKKNLLFIFSSITIIMSIYAHSVNSFFFFFFFENPPNLGNMYSTGKSLNTKCRTFGGTSSIQMHNGKDILASLAKARATLLPCRLTCEIE